MANIRINPELLNNKEFCDWLGIDIPTPEEEYKKEIVNINQERFRDIAEEETIN